VAHCCVRLIADAAASAALRVGPDDHPLARLLARPSPEQTGVELMETFFGHLQVAGNAYLEATAFEDGPPRELFALRPDRMAVIPDARCWPVGWEFRLGANVRRYERAPLMDAAPILHLKHFHPLGAWQGEVPLGEESEAYQVDILDGGAIQRSWQTTTPSVTYAAVDQIADFGGPPASLSVRISQISQRHGAGRGRDSILQL
jgi:phage portal protein BeeE